MPFYYTLTSPMDRSLFPCPFLVACIYVFHRRWLLVDSKNWHFTTVHHTYTVWIVHYHTGTLVLDATSYWYSSALAPVWLGIRLDPRARPPFAPKQQTVSSISKFSTTSIAAVTSTSTTSTVLCTTGTKE